MVGLSDGFAGAVSVPCGRCKAKLTHPTNGIVQDRRIFCHCGKWLLTGRVLAGTACVYCKRCKALTFIRSGGAQRPPEVSDAMLVERIEERWRLMRLDRARRRADIAVGLRFDVFNRDGFRCRYCGVGVDKGAILEADHVIPRSIGGPDTLANLVTACWDCNRGKSDKILAS